MLRSSGQLGVLLAEPVPELVARDMFAVGMFLQPRFRGFGKFGAPWHARFLIVERNVASTAHDDILLYGEQLSEERPLFLPLRRQPAKGQHFQGIITVAIAANSAGSV